MINEKRKIIMIGKTLNKSVPKSPCDANVFERDRPARNVPKVIIKLRIMPVNIPFACLLNLGVTLY